jgi:hypothetical protein
MPNHKLPLNPHPSNRNKNASNPMVYTSIKTPDIEWNWSTPSLLHNIPQIYSSTKTAPDISMISKLFFYLIYIKKTHSNHTEKPFL